MFGQGGPPMLTDDPGTPGPGKWEDNIAFAFEHRPGETFYDTPQFDLNDGVGEHIQLNLQGGPILLKHAHEGVIGGMDMVQTAVKWRFLDEEDSGLDMSVYPRILFNITHSSVRRGLTEDGTRFQLPLEIAKKFGPVQINPEAGTVLSTVGRSEWLYGVVAGLEIRKGTEIMAEIHGNSRTNFSHDVLIANLGLRHELAEHQILIMSIGHEIRNSEETRALIGYFGMQLVF